MNTRQVLRCSLIVITALVLVYLLNQYNKQSQMEEFKVQQASKAQAAREARAKAQAARAKRRLNKKKNY